MRAANLMRAAHRRRQTKLSRTAHHPPGSTPSHFPARACARQCRKTAAHFHKGYKALPADARCKPDARDSFLRLRPGNALPRGSASIPHCRQQPNCHRSTPRSSEPLPSWQTAARLADIVQLSCHLYLFVHLCTDDSRQQTKTSRSGRRARGEAGRRKTAAAPLKGSPPLRRQGRFRQGRLAFTGAEAFHCPRPAKTRLTRNRRRRLGHRGGMPKMGMAHPPIACHRAAASASK